LTNDDGIASDGLWAAARGLARVGDVTVIGTRDDWSGGSAAIRMTIGARLTRYTDIPDDLGPNVEAYAIDAAPGGAILAGLMTGLFEPFDLVASGSNYGVNVGGDLLHSGTLGAAATAFQRGVTAFGISAERGVYRGDPQRWDGVSDVAERVARWMLARSGPPILINVNVPNRHFDAMVGAVVVPPVNWANMERVTYRVRSDRDGEWEITAVVDNSLVHHEDGHTDAGAVERGLIAVTHVIPSGWPIVPPPDDLDDLVAALTPSIAAGPYII
jgi:5'-nucleotidase